MRKSNSGVTLIELLLTIAIMAIVIPLGYLLLFTGNGMFNVSTGKGFSQQDVRLLADFLKNELQYVSRVSDNSSDFTTRYYSLEYDDSSNQLTKRYYVLDETTLTITESIVQTISGDWDILNISNSQVGILDINIGHVEKVGNKESRYDLPLTLNLPNASTLSNAVSVNLTDTISGSPARLYYVYPKDSLVNVSIGITDLESGGGGETIGIRTISFDANNGLGSVASISRSIGADVTIPASTGLSKSGSTFLNWNTKPDGTGVSYNPSETIKMPENNLILYAIWTDDSVVINNITFGSITKIDNMSPIKVSSTSESYKILKKDDAKIVVGMNNYTEEYKDIVKITATSTNGASVSPISQVIKSGSNYFIEVICKTPKSHDIEFSIELTTQISNSALQKKTFYFKTFNNFN